MDEVRIQQITGQIAAQFTTFGGGRTILSNPLAHALKDQPPMFAMGVEVEAVVRAVLEAAEPARVGN